MTPAKSPYDRMVEAGRATYSDMSDRDEFYDRDVSDCCRAAVVSMRDFMSAAFDWVMSGAEVPSADDTPKTRIPDGYRAVGCWFKIGGGCYFDLRDCDAVMNEVGTVVTSRELGGSSLGGTESNGLWFVKLLDLNKEPCDDEIPSGWLKDGPWERGGSATAGIGMAISGYVYSTGRGCPMLREEG